ncbi:sphingomyelin phosphodiesterase-like isoform X2 [Varroa destructor]|uniref:Sphingomyelin phosphodiesterase n=1 Tax=Varroa destructor TaxID=109461 RepID=A0A7M7KQ62_VARDE|nr:sphingomyelin phosphodiesterase-like isoform X2 [Varroa destructor]
MLSILGNNATDVELCAQCEAAMRALRHYGYDHVIDKLKAICIAKMSFYNEETCLSMIDMYKDEMRYLLYQLKVPDTEFCRFVTGCGQYNDSLYRWKFDVFTNQFEAYTQIDVFPEASPFAVLHLADPHVSFEYRVGVAYSCREELCCTNRQMTPVTNMSAEDSGPYGEPRKTGLYGRCDLPVRTLRSALKSAASLKFDFVYITGDFIPHTSFNFSFSRVIYEITEQTRIINEALPNKDIYVSIGNHDDYPSFLFPTDRMVAGKYSSDRLYYALWKIWGDKWIPTEAKDTFLKGGFYTASISPGVRLFSLNTNYCYKLNWWLAVDPEDPEGQLRWLDEGLAEAARMKEKVHIIGHIPPGTKECHSEWATAYQKIISKHSQIINGQFFGHMHWDQFTVDWSVEDDPKKQSIPTGVQISSPSITTYMTGYPSYRILKFDKFGGLEDIDTYMLNITALNKKFLARTKGFDRRALDKAVQELDRNDKSYRFWQKMYSTRAAYGLKDLSPNSFADLIERFAKNDSLLEFYYRALYQFHEEPSNVHCSKGVCTTNYYYRTGLEHYVTCEQNSYGSTKFTECEKAVGEIIS